MVNCAICKQKIKETFLDKIIGSYVKIDGKLKTICKDCQKIYSHKDIIEKLK